MKTYFKLLAVLLLCRANGLFAQTTTGSIFHNGIIRNYRLHRPPNFQQSEHLPLVFNLHGFTSNGQQQELYSGMNAVSDTARFLICYPDGVSSAWNIGATGGSTADDLGFIAALIDRFQTEYNIDLERVYSCGMSNGGFFSYRLACEMGDRIAAIASVTGSMTTGLLSNCDPVRPVPVLEIHGNADPIVDYDGSSGIASISDVFDFWVGQNGCTGPAEPGVIPNSFPGDDATASFEAFRDCEDDTEVILVTVQNGGHTWPGAAPTFVFGPTCQDFNASVEIWGFFNRFKLDLPSAAGEVASQTAGTLVSPNPFQAEVNIVGGELVRVFDAQGRAIWSGEGVQALPTQAWRPGIYFFWVKNGDMFVCKKMLKR